jgi:hypothetical protein
MREVQYLVRNIGAAEAIGATRKKSTQLSLLYAKRGR